MKYRRNLGYVFGRLVAFATPLLVFAGMTVAAEWKIETVDPSGSGHFTSMKIDVDGNVHVAYIPESEGNPLKYAFWDHRLEKWFTMTVSKAASFCALTLDSKQRPHISYTERGMAKGAKLRYVAWDGASWHDQAVSPANDSIVGYYSSIGLDAADNPTFSYYDYVGPGGADNTLRLRSVSRVDSHWEVRLVDRTRGSGKFNSLAVDSKGRPRIAYANVSWETSGLRYAEWNGSEWSYEVIEGISEPCPIYSVALVLDKNDNPHIAYTDVRRRLVKYATRRNGKWQTEAVDSISAEAYPDRNGIAVDNDGNPYLGYYDGGAGTLKVAYRKSGKWYGEVLDQNAAGFTSSLQISGGMLWVSYADDGIGALKVARRPLVEIPVPSAQKVQAVSHNSK
jgi:hypothetical protein